jgi:hypothetical protein
MAMTVSIQNGIGASTGTWTDVSVTATWNREDDIDDTDQPIPTPTATGTNFSFIKSFAINITTVAGLVMTGVKFGKVAAETTTGTKLWEVKSRAIASYIQATAAPTATGDNNVTGPTMNTVTGTATPLIGSASVYAAGPFNTTGKQGTIVEVCLGVDATNTTAGTAVATPTMRWSWTEA